MVNYTRSILDYLRFKIIRVELIGNFSFRTTSYKNIKHSKHNKE